MSHDYDVGCAAPNDGIMGFKKYGWSTCSAYNLIFFIGIPTKGHFIGPSFLGM